MNISYSLSIVISYGLQGYVAFEIIWGYYEERAKEHGYSAAWEYLIRACILFTSGKSIKYV